jgi:hypothetical protein
MRTCIVKMVWDDGIWYTKADEDLGLVLESDSFDALIERVRLAVPEMLELNCGYTGAAQIIFVTERVDTMKAVG